MSLRIRSVDWNWNVKSGVLNLVVEIRTYSMEKDGGSTSTWNCKLFMEMQTSLNALEKRKIVLVRICGKDGGE